MILGTQSAYYAVRWTFSVSPCPAFVYQKEEKPARLKGREWQCLAEIVWSEMPAVQVVAWRMLNCLAKREDWAREVIEEVFLDEELEAWAKSDELLWKWPRKVHFTRQFSPATSLGA